MGCGASAKANYQESPNSNQHDVDTSNIEELILLESRVAEIGKALPDASDLEALQKELQSLELRAKDMKKTIEKDGKEDANEDKQDMLRRVDTLFSRLEEMFDQIQKRNAAEAAAPVETVESLGKCQEDLTVMEKRVEEVKLKLPALVGEGNPAIQYYTIDDLPGLKGELEVSLTKAIEIEARGKTKRSRDAKEIVELKKELMLRCGKLKSDVIDTFVRMAKLCGC